MTEAARNTPGAMASRDLTARQAIVGAYVAMTVITAIDLADGGLDLLFSVGFVLIVITVPLAVDLRGLFPAGVLPPVLLITMLLAVCIIVPSAIQVDGMAKDAGTVARLIASTLDHGLTLLVGQVIALALIGLRLATSAR